MSNVDGMTGDDDLPLRIEADGVGQLGRVGDVPDDEVRRQADRQPAYRVAQPQCLGGMAGGAGQVASLTGRTVRIAMDKAVQHLDTALTWREEGCGPHGETGLLTADPAAWGDIWCRKRRI